jgi:hypothetical protein
LSDFSESESTQIETPDSEPAPPPSEEAPAFPWPPTDVANVINAVVETVEQSVRAPTEFFRAMPKTGYSSAITYFLMIGVVSAGLRLFWNAFFDLAGYGYVTSWMSDVIGATPAERLSDFLLSPVALLIAMFFVPGVVHAALKIIGGASERYVTTTRAFAFSSAPQLFVIVPFIGSFAAFVGTLILFTIALREAHRTTTGRAALAIFLPVAALILFAMFALLMIVVAALTTWLGLPRP